LKSASESNLSDLSICKEYFLKKGGIEGNKFVDKKA